MPNEALEMDLITVYDIIYRDYEYFPEGPIDLKKDREQKIKLLRGSLN